MLARKIAEKEDCDIKFDTLDLLNQEEVEQKFAGKFQILVDKGTFDAISLSETAARDKARYVESAARLVSGAGLLLLTSCNWTRAELAAHLASHFALLETVPTPTFTFGGKTGASTTFCIFRRK